MIDLLLQHHLSIQVPKQITWLSEGLSTATPPVPRTPGVEEGYGA